MGLLDRFLQRNRSSQVSEAPTTFVLLDKVRERASTALDTFSGDKELGILQHLIFLDHSDQELKAYLLQNKEAADLIFYCHHRFNGKRIPAELHYIHGKIVEVVQSYGSRILGQKNSGIRNLVKMHLKINKGSSRTKVLFDSKNNDILLERLREVVKMISEKEEHYISLKKADFLLQELGLFEQNHYSTNSYLCYDQKLDWSWSKGTKFALTYLASEIPLDNLRLSLLSKIIAEVPSEEGMNQFSKAYAYATQVEDETLTYGLGILDRNTKNLSTNVRDTLRDRFTERHSIFWKWLKERAGNLIIDSQYQNDRESRDFHNTDQSSELYPNSPEQSNFLPLN